MTSEHESITDLVRSITTTTRDAESGGQFIRGAAALVQALAQPAPHTGESDAMSRSGDAATLAEEQGKLVSSLRRMLETREAEISTLKNGGEIASFRRYLGGFIRAHQTAVDASKSDRNSDSALLLVRDLVADALDACGVETFAPEVGADFRKEAGVAEKPEVIPAKDASQAFQIESVVAVGYRREKPDGYDIIVPAKVRVFSPTATP